MFRLAAFLALVTLCAGAAAQEETKEDSTYYSERSKFAAEKVKGLLQEYDSEVSQDVNDLKQVHSEGTYIDDCATSVTSAEIRDMLVNTQQELENRVEITEARLRSNSQVCVLLKMIYKSQGRDDTPTSCVAAEQSLNAELEKIISESDSAKATSLGQIKQYMQACVLINTAT